MFRYEFAVIALIVAFFLGIAFPLLGGTVVHKRLSSSGDALAHSSLAGVAIGLVCGLYPLAMSVVLCVVSFLIINALRYRFGRNAEIGVAVVLSASIALAGILSSYTPAANFSMYLFGSIFLVDYVELGVVIGLSVVATAFAILTFYRQFHCLYSGVEAKTAGIHVRLLDFAHSLLFALLVAIGAKIVGSLVVSSMIVLPTAAALLLKKGYRATALISLVVSLVSMVGGVVVAYYLDWKPGATSAALAIVILLAFLLVRLVESQIKKRRYRQENPL